jgi:hypothetical protein
MFKKNSRLVLHLLPLTSKVERGKDRKAFFLHFHPHLRVKVHYFIPCPNGTKRLSKIKIKCSSVRTKKVTVILLSLLSFIFISPGLKDKFLLNIFPAPCGCSSKISVLFMEAVKINQKINVTEVDLSCKLYFILIITTTTTKIQTGETSSQRK